MPCERGHGNRGPSRPRLITPNLQRNTSKPLAGQKMDPPSSMDSDSESVFWDMKSQSDSDTDLDSSSGDVEPQPDSDTSLELNEISREVESDGDSAYHSGREVVCLRKTNAPNGDEQAAFILQQIARHKKAGPAMADHALKTKVMIEKGKVYWEE
jgi:hypothetical protein